MTRSLFTFAGIRAAFGYHADEPKRAAAALGRLGGRARAEQQRAPIRARTLQMRTELGLGPDPRLA
jgi:hypothetical protein